MSRQTLISVACLLVLAIAYIVLLGNEPLYPPQIKH